MKILFVCNGNVARSQMAEVFFNDLSKNHESVSAGVDVILGKPINPKVVEVVEEIGYSLDGAKRKFATSKMINNADLVVSFKPRKNLPNIFEKAENFEFWDIPDPRHQSAGVHRDTRDKIMTKVKELVNKVG